MARLPTYEEMGKKVAEEVLDGYIYKGKILREWIDLLAQTRWIPVSEGLPKEGQRVLVADKFEAVTTALYFGESPFWREMVVAWMPLPERYKEETDEKNN